MESPITNDQILEAVSSLLLGEPSPKFDITEASKDKLAVEKIVRSYLKKELGDEVKDQLKKALKDQDFESIVAAVTGRVLGRFFEIMWTRKSTWQSQLKP